ncbi:carboxymuconolactone decarboxylase family protein [Halalkalibacter alkaliphilus]|uniref:Carboxymuconolactone decarboxylase family protein n=1 Tax=Halalkalibacter alkaliphilus TaxID=2917993 RepID=A0A9X2CWN3_9BACI|nr:carboxymuconolactone decarboxylase family protein [Halalkalibacter alkaliphilus]MCL7749613.1 carboxymuconolactone decarboxylase family protein [Halalkalibacter alkaliphilus]
MANHLYEKGLEIRKVVIGEEFVEKAIKNANDFNQPLQELVTEYCWGKIWAREGLSMKTRSMLNLAMLTALNRPDEMKIHVRGALTNGVTKEEIKEIYLQTAIYCGLPAAIDSFKLAQQVFDELEVDE